MRDIHRQPHIRKVKAVAQPDERNRNDMVSHQLFKVLARLLELQHQHYRLLRPIRRL